jgi:hypothetical protein
VNTSFRVVELVRQKIGSEYLTASDADVSRVLGVSRTTISSYRHGKSVMSLDTFALAQEVLQLPEQQAFEFMLQLSAEGSASSQLQGLWQSMHKAVKRVGTRVGALALAMLAAGTIFAPTGKLEASALSSQLTDIHYANARKRRLRALARKFSSFLMPFPSHAPADALASARSHGAHNMRNGIFLGLAFALSGCSSFYVEGGLAARDAGEYREYRHVETVQVANRSSGPIPYTTPSTHPEEYTTLTASDGAQNPYGRLSMGYAFELSPNWTVDLNVAHESSLETKHDHGIDSLNFSVRWHPFAQ